MNRRHLILHGLMKSPEPGPAPSGSGLLMKHTPRVLLAALALLVATGAMARKDPLTNPDAVPHHIDRSAMEIQLQGWSRDLKFPVYPIQVQRGGSGVYYMTNENAADYKEFSFDALRCEIGDAPREVLKLKNYECADGVCMTAEGAIVGTDPRRPVNKKHRCH